MTCIIVLTVTMLCDGVLGDVVVVVVVCLIWSIDYRVTGRKSEIRLDKRCTCGLSNSPEAVFDLFVCP